MKKTGFQSKVFAAVSKIPKGKTTTYARVAKAAGSPNAARAVGNVLAANTNPIKTPCHRVVCSDGRIGGYLGKKDSVRKIRLLKKEGVKIRKGKVEKKHFS
jgi:methylated-DNA-[protein]-cysteine S-methyltransferase